MIHFKSILIITIETYKWSIEEINGFKPDGRDGHSACVIQDSMLIFGGYVENVYIYIYNYFRISFISVFLLANFNAYVLD